MQPNHATAANVAAILIGLSEVNAILGLRMILRAIAEGLQKQDGMSEADAWQFALNFGDIVAIEIGKAADATYH